MGITLERKFLFIFLLPIWVIVRLVLFYLRKNNKSNFSIKREIILNLFFIYILCLLSVTLFPLTIIFGSHENWSSINLIPIIETVKYVSNTLKNSNLDNYMINFWIKNIVGNMLLLFPLGVMLPMLFKKFQSLAKTSIFAFCLSLSIEILQLLSGYIGNTGRAFDIDDILLNSIGAILGFILYNKFVKFFTKKKNLNLVKPNF